MYKGLYKTLLAIFIMLVAAATNSISSQNLAVTNILSPTTALNCTTTPRTDDVTVRISNLGGAAITNFDISYSLNGGAVITETYTGAALAAGGGFTNYTFSTKLNTSTGGVNILKAFTSLAGDLNKANDTAYLTYVPKVATFPYYENFEASNGGFTAGGTNSTWTWGARSKANTGKAGEGTKCWTNGGLTGYYSNSDNSFLRSPCYDFTNLKNPYIEFKFVTELEYNYEVVTLQYSLNGGASWSNLGSSADVDNCETKNWFNTGGWSGNANSYPCSFGWGGGCNGKSYCGKWSDAKHCIAFLAGQPSVMFQWAFTSSGTQCTSEGFALDSLVLGEAPALTPFKVTAPATVCQKAPAFFSPTLASCYKNPRWDFGDTTPILSSLVAAHAYKNAGTYTAKLMAEGLCGKIDTLFTTITITPAPITSITGLADSLCQAGAVVNLTGTPAGGKFYVDGVQKNSIDPSAYTLGKHYVVYEYKDPAPGGCTATDTVPFTIYMPSATIDNLGGQYCPSAPAFVLKGSPAGGTFSIDGVIGSTFDASTLALGSHTVIYAYTDKIGCPASETKIVDINNSLVVTLTGLSNFYCAGEPAIALTGTPTGGVFYVNGTATTKYDPAALAATPAADTVIYYYSDGACANADTVTVDVIKNNPSITGLNAIYCYDAPAVNLSATPAGGIFTLDGATAFSINPKTTASGAHRVVYTYQDTTYNCLDSAVSTVTIDKPTAKISGLLPNYCIDANAVTLTALPAGGTFTLNGTPATQIDPFALGTGKYKIEYTYTNTNGCVVKDTQSVSVVGLPVVNFTGLSKNLCFNSAPLNLTTNPSGGAFTIDGLPVSGNTFDPSLYPAGKYHVVEYTFVDFVYGCVNSIKDSVFVGTPPAVSINGLNTQYCNSDDIVQLSGVPMGGQFEINGAPATSFNPKTLGAGTHTVKYSYTDANGCFNQISQLVDVISNPGDTITPRPRVEICPNQKITLSVSGSLPGIWSTSETTSSITVQPASTTVYWYKVTDCASYYDSVTVVVNTNPSANFDMTPKDGFVPLDITAKDKSTGSTSIKWIVEDKEFTADPLKYTFTTPGQFKVKLAVTNDKGCVDTVEQVVTVFAGITIPNVFSPNGDYVNDDFGPITKGTYNSYSFKIFDRWGALMFEASKPEQRWDGSHNGNPAPDGTYFYLLVAANPTEFKLEGTVTLIR
jgi:gliding motility-associated-like protein